jgi:hypothetical protein
MAAVQFEGQDEVMCIPSRWAFGFSPQRPGGVPSRPGSTFGMVGMNGSAAYADIDTGVADFCSPGCSQPDLRRKE